MGNEINLLCEEIEESQTSPAELETILTTIAEKTSKTREQKEHWEPAKKTLEALLFASTEPLSLKRLREVIDSIYPFKPRHLLTMLGELKTEYKEQNRAFTLEEIGQGYLLKTLPKYGEALSLLFRNKRTEKLSSAATEVLAIIAYKQPITRPGIEAIRGVDCSGITQNLLERELIEVVGRLEAPGRPALLSVTTNFYKYFGINDLKDLPKPGQIAPTEAPITLARDEEIND